jgi:hypothetical protein
MSGCLTAPETRVHPHDYETKLGKSSEVYSKSVRCSFLSRVSHMRFRVRWHKNFNM